MAAPAPLAPALPRPRKLTGTPRPFSKKPRPYEAVLREAELHPSAPAHHRRAHRAMQCELAMDTTGSVVSETRWCVEPYCGAPATATLSCAWSGDVLLACDCHRESVAAQLPQAAEVAL
jgi:hypothetical protein